MHMDAVKCAKVHAHGFIYTPHVNACDVILFVE